MHNIEERPVNLNNVLGLRADQDGQTTHDGGANPAGNENARQALDENIDTAGGIAGADQSKPGFDWFRFLFFVSLIATISFTTISLLQPANSAFEEQLHLLTFAVGVVMILLWLIIQEGNFYQIQEILFLYHHARCC